MAAHATRRGSSTLAPSAGDDRGRLDLIEQVGRLFDDPAAGPPGTAGLEVELICVSGRPPRPVPAARTRAAIEAADPGLLVDGRVSFEPGGQLELSPLPCASTAALLAHVSALVDRLRRALARDRIVAVSTGMNPWHTADEVGLQVDAERYLVMQRHFDSIGDAGRDMMRLTASLQVCVEQLRGDAGVEQWQLANRMGPALSAAFANSAVERGDATGWTSARSRLWQQLDASRTGFDGAQVGGDDPVAAYTRFAESAEAMPLARGRSVGRAGEPVPFRASFARWSAAGGARPDADDVTHHLSTLFPPVRPRGYLELRYLDAPPLKWLPAPVLALQVLLGDARARRQALEVLDDADRGSLLALWHAAAHQGLANPWLRHEARSLVDIALAAARRLPRASAPAAAVALLAAYRDTYMFTGRCWSDDQVERIIGPDAEDPNAWT
jgi:glutamate--cysteine ligase